MNPRKQWMTIGAVVAFSGAGFLTGAAIALNDSMAPDAGSAVMLKAGASDMELVADVDPVDDSPESADSPNESAVDSADSPFDSPNDPQYIDPNADSADSPAPAPAVVSDTSADSPVSAPAPAPVYKAPAPVQQAPVAPQPVQDSPDSADSP